MSVKIDTSTIEGYGDMTPEQKVAALEGMELIDPDVQRYKDACTKANSEAAEWKKKHNARLSEDEKKSQEAAENLAAITKERDELKRAKTVSEHKATYLSLGYGDDLAGKAAEALADGNMALVFQYQKEALTAHDKAVKAEHMRSTPPPPAGNPVTGASALQKSANDALARGDYATYCHLIDEMNSNANPPA